MSRTTMICTVMMIVLGIYDGTVVSFYGIDASISRFMQVTAFNSPIFMCMIMFLCGHFFGYMKPNPVTEIFTAEEIDKINEMVTRYRLTQIEVVQSAMKQYIQESDKSVNTTQKQEN